MYDIYFIYDKQLNILDLCLKKSTIVLSKPSFRSKAPLSLALGLAAFHALALAFALCLVDFGCFIHPDPLSTWSATVLVKSLAQPSTVASPS